MFCLGYGDNSGFILKMIIVVSFFPVNGERNLIFCCNHYIKVRWVCFHNITQCAKFTSLGGT